MPKTDREIIRDMLGRLVGGVISDERMTYLEWADTGGPRPGERASEAVSFTSFVFDDDGALIAVEGGPR